jgi:hypothetical protein
MADTEEQKKQFEVRLFQQARIHTETFPVEADNEADALKEAQEIIKTKDLEDGYDLEVHDITPVAPPAAPDDAPEEDEALEQQPQE